MTGRRLSLKVGLASALLLFGALLLEGVARVLIRNDDDLREQCLDGDEYWIARWFALREGGGGKPGETALLVAGDPVHGRHPKLGWAPLPRLRRDGLTTNELGLRGSAEVAATKRDGERRIVALGDSFTFGEGVRDEEVWTAQLAARAAAHDVAVLNLGVMGYGLDQVCLRFEELGPGLAPDVVLLGLFGPDLDRNELTFRDDAKPRFVLTSDGLALDNVPVPGDQELRARLKPPVVEFYSWAILSKGVATLRQGSRSAPKWELARRILDRLRDASTRAGAPLVVAWFPAKRGSFSREPEIAELVVAEWAAARGVPLINVREAFVALGSKRFGDVWEGHWTPYGNEIVAQAVHEGLLRERVLPRP